MIKADKDYIGSLLNLLMKPYTPLLVLAFIFLSGFPKYGISYRWLIISVLGSISFLIGYIISNKLPNKTINYIGFLVIMLMTWASFRWSLGPITAAFASILWGLVLAQASMLHRELSSSKFYPWAVGSIYALGAVLIITSVISHGGWERIRAMPNIPEEGAFGIFLLYITYPYIGSYLLSLKGKRKSFYFTAFMFVSGLLMALHGFRSDVMFILLSSTVLLMAKGNLKSVVVLLMSVILIFLSIDIIRFEASLGILERILYRLSTTYYYSYRIVDIFWNLSVMEPLWIYSIPMHPTQVVGRAFFFKNYGITTTLFCGLFIVNGYMTLISFSLLLGLFVSEPYRDFLKGSPSAYALVWPLLVTRMEIGLTQLDIVLIAATSLFRVMLSENGSHTQIAG